MMMATRHLKMTLKLLIFLTTCVFIVQANNHQQADDTEAFITKEAAKELRSKLSDALKEQSDDYDDVLKDMIRVFQNRQKSEQQFYFEKKYFDYLPNEVPAESDDSMNEEFNFESINQSSGGGKSPSVDDEESDGVRRAKRDVVQQQQQQQGRNKRQLWYSVPLYHNSPVPNLHFYYPIDLFSDFPETLPAFQPRPYNNPWTPNNNPSLRFHPPGNFYLPPSSLTPRPPPTYLPPSPTYRPPVNVPQPPHNQVDDEEFKNRVGGFEGDDKPYVFDFRPNFPSNNVQGNTIKGGGGGGGYNNNNYAPPQPPHPRPTVRPIDNSLTNNEEIEIEYAPEILDDVSTTTRASIKRPTRKNQNKSQQQHNRQKKSAFRFL